MKKVYVLFAEGFEEVEALTTVDYLRRSGTQVSTVSITNLYHVGGAHGVNVQTDYTLTDLTDKPLPDALILPGGLPGATNLRDDPQVIQLLKQCMDEKQLVAAICAAPLALEKAGVLDGRRFTCYPSIEDQIHQGTFVEENVVVDHNLITARGPAISIYFALAIVEYLFDKEMVSTLRKDLLLDLAEQAISL